MGLAAAIPFLTGTSSSGAGTDLTLPHSPSAGASPGEIVPGVGGVISAAATVACRTNYSAAEAAIQQYEAEFSSVPTKISQVQTLLRDPLSSPAFTITIDPKRPGQLQVGTKSHVAADGSANCAAAG